MPIEPKINIDLDLAWTYFVEHWNLMPCVKTNIMDTFNFKSTNWTLNKCAHLIFKIGISNQTC
jgi:hypothetical protein